MLYDVHLVLVLVLLHIEHFSEFLQLMQFTEGFQNHQHGNQAKQQVACDPDLIEFSELLVVAFSRNIVPQTNGAQGDETKIKRFQEVPVILQN